MSQDGDDDTYDNTHRAFLQSFISRATLTFDQAKPILAAIYSAQDGRDIQANDIQETDLQNYIHTINASISPFDLEIRSTLSQTTKTRIYALVNTTSDPITQLATTHTPDEIAYVKRVLDAIFETNNTVRAEVLAVAETKALHLNKAEREEEGVQAQSLSMMQAQRMLGGMIEEGWFELSERGFVSLTPRALMELRGWLIETYNDEDEVRVRFCEACRDIVTVGERCPDVKCPARMHNHCKPKIFRAEHAERCPVCKTPWEDPLFVGERASARGRQSDSGGARRSNTRTQGAADDESEEEDSDEG